MSDSITRTFLAYGIPEISRDAREVTKLLDGDDASFPSPVDPPSEEVDGLLLSRQHPVITYFPKTSGASRHTVPRLICTEWV